MSKGSKTIIILSPGFPKDETDTTCLPFLQQFVSELKLQFPGLQIVILSLDYPFVRHSYLWNDVRVFSFNGWNRGRIVKLITWQRVLKTMKKIRSENEVVGLLSLWCGACAYLGNRFAKNNNLKHFCWIQGQDAKKGNRYVSMIRPSPEELIAISDFIRSEFEKNYAVRPNQVIPAGINPAEFTTSISTRPIDILGVGSLIPLKQYALFIEIIYLIKQSIPGIHAVICGKGPEEAVLKALIWRYDLQNNIVLTGELPHAEIVQFMMKSKVFLHTSNYEGFSIACMEALYAGCHVLSFVQSMFYDIEHWHILSTKEQMAERARILLGDSETNYNTVMTFTVFESVQEIMKLFS
jgi:glycosyltransferase involved in cell wall biosynthesis